MTIDQELVQALDPQADGVVYLPKTHGHPRSHERATQYELSRRIAALMGAEFLGIFDVNHQYGRRLYFVPGDTLSDIAYARQLGIAGELDLFGGVVPHSFVATKTITHPLHAPTCRAPSGWENGLCRHLDEAVLPGFSAFTREDALAAGMRMFAHGPVRLKKASGIGGTGQVVVNDANELDAQLALVDEQELDELGVVLELNLDNVETQSVGQVRIGAMVATYCGSQRLTHNNRGEAVYGGSTLLVVRGDFDALLALELSPQVRTAVAQARTYHAAAIACYPGMFTSRANYDIARGRTGTAAGIPVYWNNRGGLAVPAARKSPRSVRSNKTQRSMRSGHRRLKFTVPNRRCRRMRMCIFKGTIITSAPSPSMRR